MRKVLTLVIISASILIVVNFKNFKNISVIDDVRIKLSKFFPSKKNNENISYK